MNTTTLVIVGIVLIVAAIFLTIAVLMQEGKSHRLSGAIAGGADTLFGKTKGKKVSDALSKWTTIVAIIFVLIVLTLTVLNRDIILPDGKLPADTTSKVTTAAPEETPAPEESKKPVSPTPDTETSKNNDAPAEK